MTITMPEATAHQQADLLHQLSAVLDAHPAGNAVRLVYAAQTAPLLPGEVLVQRLDVERRVLELHPTPLAEVRLRDVLHETQVLRPGDPALGLAAVEDAAEMCTTSTSTGNTRHAYWT